MFTLSDNLACIKLRNDALQHFVDDRRKHALVIVYAKFAINSREGIDFWTREDTTGDVNHLKICGRLSSEGSLECEKG